MGSPLVQLFGPHRSGTTWAEMVLTRNYDVLVLGRHWLPGEGEAFKHGPYRPHPAVEEALRFGQESRVRTFYVMKAEHEWWFSMQQYDNRATLAEWERHRDQALRAENEGAYVLWWAEAVRDTAAVFGEAAEVLELTRRPGDFDPVPGYVRRDGSVLDRPFIGEATSWMLQ